MYDNDKAHEKRCQKAHPTQIQLQPAVFVDQVRYNYQS